jgi:acetyl-CoA acyltransferase
MSAHPSGRPVLVVDACRTPFLRSGTEFRDLRAFDLGRMALAGLLERNPIDPGAVGMVVLGTVVADPDTSNVARESALGADVPAAVPAFTVTAACISANVAFRQAASAIADGEIDLAVAGGTETLSDVPIRFSRPLRKRLIAAQKVKGVGGWLGLLRGVRLGDLAPQVPAIADFSTRLTMGENAERLAKRLGIGREAQDEFALRSHHNAARAAAEGKLARQIVPAWVPPEFRPVRADNGVRADTSMDKLKTLRPVFDRELGTITAGNSSYLTDGASAVLLASEDAVRARGLVPKARVVSQALVAMDPLEELLLGPALAIPLALERAGLELDDVDVFELHEAFAGQMLAVLVVLEDERFARERLRRDRPVGRIDLARLNRWGGSLSVGHPFGATGGRLVATCCDRLQDENGRYGLIAACASGALGYAVVLERTS